MIDANFTDRNVKCSIFALATAMAVAAAPSGAIAQDTGATRTAANEGLGNTIIVTARKREEALSDVPLAVTVLDPETINRAGVQSLEDVSALTPGLTFSDLGSGYLALPVIRGLAQTNLSSAEGNTSVFLDGVYLSDLNTLNLDLLDLARIEVVKGPQSALYGQNSFAGAINYVSSKPGNEFKGSFKGTIGNADTYEARGSISGPLVEGLLSARVAAGYSNYGGTVKNRGEPGNNVGGYETTSIAGGIVLTPSDSIEAIVNIYYTDRSIEPSPSFLVPYNCGRTASGAFSWFCGEVPSVDSVDLTPGGITNVSNLIVSGEFNWEITDKLSFKSITGYVSSKSDNFRDIDFTSAGTPVVTNLGRTVGANTWLSGGNGDTKDFSQEVRLDYQDDRWGLTVGGFIWDHEKANTSFAAVDTSPLMAGERFPGFIPLLFGTVDPLGSPVLSNQNVNETNTWAIFGRAEAEILPSFTVSGEVRYTEETKRLRNLIQFTTPRGTLQEGDFNFVTWRTTAEWEAADDLMIYGSAAKGSRSGGFNSNPGANVGEETFAPEFNTTYEIGVKKAFEGGRYNLNIAAFYIDWTDIQIPGVSLDPTNIFAVIRNIGNATSKGFEIEASGSPSEYFSFNIGYAYADPTLDKGTLDRQIIASCGVDGTLCTIDPATGFADVGGSQVIRTSKHQLNASGTVTMPISSSWNAYLRADLSYQSKQYTRPINSFAFNERTLINSRLGFENDNLEIAIWVKNLTNEKYIRSNVVQPLFFGGTQIEAIQNEGRTIGLTGTFNF